MSIDSKKQTRRSGDYFRVDYDAHLDQYSFHHPGWWNAHEYFARTPLLDHGWREAAVAGLAAESDTIRLGRLGPEWPAVAASCVARGPGWLRVELSLGGAPAVSVLLLCGVNRPAEAAALRAFNATAGRQPRVRRAHGPPRPYRLRERPLCAALWWIDKNDSAANNTANLALQALAAAYFRSKWVA